MTDRPPLLSKLNQFQPVADPAPGPAPGIVRTVAEEAGFSSRTRAPEPPPASPTSRRQRTGRTVQLGARVRQSVADDLYAIVDAERARYDRGEITHLVSLGEVVEWAVAALLRERAAKG